MFFSLDRRYLHHLHGAIAQIFFVENGIFFNVSNILDVRNRHSKYGKIKRNISPKKITLKKPISELRTCKVRSELNHILDALK